MVFRIRLLLWIFYKNSNLRLTLKQEPRRALKQGNSYLVLVDYPPIDFGF